MYDFSSTLSMRTMPGCDNVTPNTPVSIRWPGAVKMSGMAASTNGNTSAARRIT